MRYAILLFVLFFLIISGCTNHAGKLFEKKIGSTELTILIDSDNAYIKFTEYDHKITKIENGILIRASAPDWMSYMNLMKTVQDFEKEVKETSPKLIAKHKFNHPNIFVVITSDDPETVEQLQNYSTESSDNPKQSFNQDKSMNLAEDKTESNLNEDNDSVNIDNYTNMHELANISRRMEIIQDGIRIVFTCDNPSVIEKLKDLVENQNLQNSLCSGNKIEISTNIDYQKNEISITFESDELDTLSLIKALADLTYSNDKNHGSSSKAMKT